MNKFHEALHKLIEKDELRVNFDQHLEKNIHAACEILGVDPSTINLTTVENINDNSTRWKFISLSFQILLSIKNDENIISINYTNDVKKLFQFIVSLGILPNLIPGIGIEITKRLKNFEKIPPENLSIQDSYYRLSETVRNLLLCLKLSPLRNFILSNHFTDLLASLFQLCYAPIKKPAKINVCRDGEFVMTKKFYGEVMINRGNYQLELDKLLFESYSPQIFKELMFLYGNASSPNWLKSTVYGILIKKLQLNDGVESLIKTVVDFGSLDTGAKWKQYDIIMKLVMTKPSGAGDNYYENISAQLMNLLDKKGTKSDIYVQIVSACIKYVFEKDENICEKHFLKIVFTKLTKYLNVQGRICVETDELTTLVLSLFSCFVETSPTLAPLPSKLLNSIIVVLFHIFIILHDTVCSKLTKNLKAVLLKYMSDCDETEIKDVFESFLFDRELNGIKQKDKSMEIIFDEDAKSVVFRRSSEEIRLSPLNMSNAFINLIKDTKAYNITISLCTYALDISMNPSVEMPGLPQERNMVAYKLLSELIGDPYVHKHLHRHPENILNIIEKTLPKLLERNSHGVLDLDEAQYQNIFILLMILSIIGGEVVLSDTLMSTLEKISNQIRNLEMKALILKVFDTQRKKPKFEVKSEYEKALEDTCDPLLPIRGHGLISLTKLIEEKDEETCKNKLYILNVAQQFLKDEDSYIYLSTIQVLAALGDAFPDNVLHILAEEYLSESKHPLENKYETRMKLGEVLLRIVKSLGENAPKYKSLLLNTFLSGVKDEDHLMRASSLSNLGEVCRVLGYKLGSVVSEVLSCIHAVIDTDKAVEARRAAVSVIRYLFVGLEKETLLFLKDDILPIYRTLKVVYASDPDDTTRLQAQLALEELNSNVIKFLLPRLENQENTAMLNED